MHRNTLMESANSNLYRHSIDLVGYRLAGRQRGMLASIHLAPIKSLGMLNLPRAQVMPHGLATEDGYVHDRGAMLAFRKPGITKDGTRYEWLRFSQREAPMLAMTDMAYDIEDRMLTLHGTGVSLLEFHAGLLEPADGDTVDVRLSMSGDTVRKGVITENSVIRWVRRFLDMHGYEGAVEDVVLLRMQAGSEAYDVPGDMHRRGHPARTLFSDGDPLTAASDATRRWMMHWLRQQHGETFREIPMRAFRPNLVLDDLAGSDEFHPNTEDLVRELEFVRADGNVPLVLTCDCVRCPVTMVDPATGVRPDKEPLAWLTQHRPHREDAPNKPTFAKNALVPERGHGLLLETGMPFVVTEES